MVGLHWGVLLQPTRVILRLVLMQKYLQVFIVLPSARILPMASMIAQPFVELFIWMERRGSCIGLPFGTGAWQNFISLVGSDFVQTSGDTMTGELTINVGVSNELVLSTSGSCDHDW